MRSVWVFEGPRVQIEANVYISTHSMADNNETFCCLCTVPATVSFAVAIIISIIVYVARRTPHPSVDYTIQLEK